MDTILTELRESRSIKSKETGPSNFVVRESRQTTSLAATQPTIRATDRVQASESALTTYVTNLEDLRVFLRSKPEADALISVLRRVHDAKPFDALHLHIPGPKQALAIKTLIDTTILDFWSVVRPEDRTLLAGVFRSVGGINALLASIRSLISQGTVDVKASSTLQKVSVLLSVLNEAVPIHSINLIEQIWTDLHSLIADGKRYEASWREAARLFGSIRIISTFAEASDALRGTELAIDYSLSSGSRYAQWVAVQVATLAKVPSTDEDGTAMSAAAQVLDISMSLGYSQDVVRSLITALGNADTLQALLSPLMRHLTTPNKQRFVEALLSWLNNVFQCPAKPSISYEEVDNTRISAVAGLFADMFERDKSVQKMALNLLQDATSSSLFNLTARRALITALARADITELTRTLSHLMTVFGDQLFIAHYALSQQESVAQNILLIAGYLHRRRSDSVTQASRSSNHMQSVSNRLACSSNRARWLGMIVGTAISRLVDSGVTKMNFGTADMETDEAAAYIGLVTVSDSIGSVRDFTKAIEQASEIKKATPVSRPKEKPLEMPVLNGKQMFGPIPRPASPKLGLDESRVTELNNEEDDEDHDLKPYAKPDSDPEDSDEDATLVNRKKARPPAYIRSLMTMLREHEDAEKFQLGIRHAAPLIRRKTGYGREVADHAEELARILANLQDPFDMDDFDQLRLQALIALVLSDAEVIAPWLSRQAFASCYSIAQRSIMLTALGLSGRELAGYQMHDRLNPAHKDAQFPSKKLPHHLHAMYDENSKVATLLDSTTRAVEQSLVRPMALAAADQTTSHLDAVKVRTFSSRMDVERTRRKPRTNALGRTFKESYFDPLNSCFQADVSTYAGSSIYVSTSSLLTLYLKTVAILLHAAGPTTLELPQITSEFWSLLLYLRVSAIQAADVMESLLFCFLTLLDVNTDQQRLTTEHPRQLMETKEWVELVFDRTGGGQLIEDAHDEESRLRTLCAAVLTKLNDIIQAYQKQLMGRWNDA